MTSGCRPQRGPGSARPIGPQSSSVNCELRGQAGSGLAKHHPARAPGRLRLPSSGPRAPGREAPGRGPGRLAEPTCLVGAVFARVPTGPRRPPTQPGSYQGRLVHARPAAGGAAPGPAAAAAAARAPARPRRPRRQEAAEPVPFHGGRPCAPPRSVPLGSTRARSARLLGPAGPARALKLSAAQPDCARSFPPDPPLGSARLPGSGTGGASRGRAA